MSALFQMKQITGTATSRISAGAGGSEESGAPSLMELISGQG